MNFFVTGVGGQLGHDVMNELLKRGHEGVGSDIQETYSGVADGSAVTKAPYYLVVGRFVPENSFEVMIREFMKSKSEKDFALITNVNDKFLNELEEKLHFKSDKRIKFVGTVYDQELLKKIRENPETLLRQRHRLNHAPYKPMSARVPVRHSAVQHPELPAVRTRPAGAVHGYGC